MYQWVSMTKYERKEALKLAPDTGRKINHWLHQAEITWYKDIEKILTEEESNHPDYMIMIKPKKGRTRQFTFDNANEATEVLAILKKKCD